jgi:hypothetical protein
MRTQQLKSIWKRARRDDASAQDELQTRIAERAYSLYEQRNREDGHALEDWLQAEREISDGTDQ